MKDDEHPLIAPKPDGSKEVYALCKGVVAFALLILVLLVASSKGV